MLRHGRTVAGTSICKATFTGIGACVDQFGNPLPSVVPAIIYIGQGVYNPCAPFGDPFPAGGMKWVGGGGGGGSETLVIQIFCRSDHLEVRVDYIHWCFASGMITPRLQYFGTRALGTCKPEGIVLGLVGDTFGCASPTSTCTLSEFVN